MDEQAIVLNKDRQHYRREQTQNRKLAKVLSAILITYLITWTPYQLLVLLQPFCPTCVNANGWYIALCLCYLNSTINPFMYALCNVNFRRAYWNILTCRFRRPLKQPNNKPFLSETKDRSLVKHTIIQTHFDN
ncbi:hypothetical protein DPMN_006526 [Dreissena polymorpha]|uniref:G-protein coupled receptors family 1 profile domain-containing protein n=1 Tax=Dreissena polymorpha TaxID=45954 RepID=A0A9D4RVG0_DREPO|nr:hypothetical protein DPMN_006526 [Dreissena polymorpha]